MCRFVCRKLVQIVQAEQPETRQLGAYLLPEKSREISHGKRTFTFAASLAWLNFTQSFHLPTQQIQLGITLKVDLAFSWMKKRAGF